MNLAGNKIKDLFNDLGDISSDEVDSKIWIRSCSEEIIEPIEGKLSGKLPEWLSGKLIMNGPGEFLIGKSQFNHLFDGMAILQKFTITNEKITYQNKFIRSEAYKQNHENNRIMFGEFGTAAESQGLFKKLMSMNSKSNLTDNTLVTFYPICDDYYALTEAPTVNRIDIETLEVLEKTNFSELLGVAILTAHPHVMNDGSTYNVGHTITATGGTYNVIHFPKGEKDIKNAKIVAKVPSRFKYHPVYIHSFGITENYYIILETPFVMSIPMLIKSTFATIPFIKCLQWLTGEQTRIILIDRATGTLSHSFYTDPFFCFHTINQYEKDNQVILDLCCYENADIVEAVKVETLTNTPKNIGKFFTKPLRFILPLKAVEKNINLVTLENSSATAIFNDEKVFCTPELISDVGFEFPRVNYPKYLATEYQYFYGVCTDLNENVGAIFKVDTQTKDIIFWKDGKSYAMEPNFVPSPNAKSEDDGVIVAGFLRSGEENQVGIVILDAKNMKELARCEFHNLPTAIPKPFHGWFISN